LENSRNESFQENTNLLITLPGYRTIKKTIVLKSSDLSANDPDKIASGDIKVISIKLEDLKKDHCSIANTLPLGLLCVDTAFVDAITSK